MIVRPSILILRNNKILLLKYNYNGNDVYGLPGGNPDSDETLHNTLIRELREELKIDVKVNEMVFVGEVTIPGKRKATLHCVFRGEVTGGTPETNPDETSALGYTWMAVEDLDSLNIYPNIGKHIKSYVHNEQKTENIYIGQIEQKWF